MPTEDGSSVDITGLSTDEAVAAVLDRTGEDDPEAVRAALDRVAEDGVVTETAVEDELAHVSKVVATPENRTEMAALEYEAAVDAADPVADLGAVRSRLDAFEARLDAVESETATLVSDLRALVDRDDRDAYETARELQRLAGAADRLQRDADELASDLEGFRDWLDDPARRPRELDEDVDAVAAGVDDVAASVGDIDGPVEWYHLSLRIRVLGLLLRDARAECEDLAAWAERENIDAGGLGDVAARLEDLDGQIADVRDSLDERARPEWRDRFGDRLAAAADDLASFDPPVEWGTVEETVDGYRVKDGE